MSIAFRIYDSPTTFVVRNSVASPPTPFPPPPPASKAWVSDWLELLLKKCALGGLGPTVVTRWQFLFSNAVWNAYAFVSDGKAPVDFPYWRSFEQGVLIASNQYDVLESWMEVACQYFVPLLIRSYMKLPLAEDEVNVIKAKHTPLVPISQSSMAVWQGLCSAYFTNRDVDGWKETFAFNGILPNGDSVIYADNTIEQNLSVDLPQPTKWTPLSLAGRTRKYLTPEWGTVNKGILGDAAFAELLEAANQMYPSDAQYEREMKDVAEITAGLTNDQKMIAEYWAGGPGSVTPPGMWMVFMDVVVRSNGLTQTQEIRNYTILASGLFQSGICAWRLKRDHLQARPVQIVRELKYNQPIEQEWNGKHLGQYWLPYQVTSFVTPPFPDFVSGHSTFSASAARLFCCLLGSDQVVLQNPMITLDILNYFSPILGNTTNFSINLLSILPGRSEVEPDVAPTTGVSFGFNSWSGMANSSGKSRIFGGIHVESSNQAGLYLGRLIADKIWEKMKEI